MWPHPFSKYLSVNRVIDIQIHNLASRRGEVMNDEHILFVKAEKHVKPFKRNTFCI